MAGLKGKSGRRPGSKNKIGREVKENILFVFQRIGGIRGMASWAKANKTEFYKLYAKLIPTEVMAKIEIRDASELSDSELLAIATGGGEGIVVETDGEEVPRELH